MTDPTRVERITQDDRDTSWMPRAACRGLSPTEIARMFFTSRTGNNADIAEGKAVCRTCPVMLACQEYGMLEYHGLWGGLSERERRRRRPAWLRAKEHRGAA